MKHKFKLIFFLALIALFACNNNPSNKTDVIAKADSIKKDSILPPELDPFVKDGEEVLRYDNGVIKTRGYYFKGKKEGQWYSWYPSGTQWSETFYEKGVKNGPTKSWYNNGKLRYEGFYKNDGKSGKWNFYDEAGKLVQSSDFSK